MITIEQIMARIKQEKADQEVMLQQSQKQIQQNDLIKQLEIQNQYKQVKLLQMELNEQRQLNNHMMKFTNEKQFNRFDEQKQQISCLKITISYLKPLIQQLREYYLIESNQILNKLKVTHVQCNGNQIQITDLRQSQKILNNSLGNRCLAIKVQPLIIQMRGQVNNIARDVADQLHRHIQIVNGSLEKACVGLQFMIQMLKVKDQAIIEQLDQSQHFIQKISRRVDENNDFRQRLQSTMAGSITPLLQKLKQLREDISGNQATSASIGKVVHYMRYIADENTRLQGENRELKQHLAGETTKGELEERIRCLEAQNSAQKEQLAVCTAMLQRMGQLRRQLGTEFSAAKEKIALMKTMAEAQKRQLGILCDIPPGLRNALDAYQHRASQHIYRVVRSAVQEISDITGQFEIQVIQQVMGLRDRLHSVGTVYKNALSRLSGTFVCIKGQLRDIRGLLADQDGLDFRGLAERFRTQVRALYENQSDSNICSIRNYGPEIEQVQSDMRQFKNAVELCKLQLQQLPQKLFTEQIESAIYNVAKQYVLVQRNRQNTVREAIVQVTRSGSEQLGVLCAQLKNMIYCNNLDVEKASVAVVRSLSGMYGGQVLRGYMGEIRTIKDRVSKLRQDTQNQMSAFTYKFVGEQNIILNKLQQFIGGQQFSNQSDVLQTLNKKMQFRFELQDLSDEIKTVKFELNQLRMECDISSSELQLNLNNNIFKRLEQATSMLCDRDKLPAQGPDQHARSAEDEGQIGQLQAKNELLMKENANVQYENMDLHEVVEKLQQQLSKQQQENQALRELLSAQNNQDGDEKAAGKQQPALLDNDVAESFNSIKTINSMQSQLTNNTYQQVNSLTIEQFIMQYQKLTDLSNRSLCSPKQLDQVRIQIFQDMHKQKLYKDIMFKIRNSNMMSMDNEIVINQNDGEYFMVSFFKLVMCRMDHIFNAQIDQIQRIFNIPALTSDNQEAMYCQSCKNYILQNYDYFIEQYLTKNFFLKVDEVIAQFFSHKLSKDVVYKFVTLQDTQARDINLILVRLLIILYLMGAGIVDCRVQQDNMMIVCPEFRVLGYKMQALQVRK